MVSFRTLITSALAFSAPIMAQITPAQVVDNIKTITDKSMALQAPAQSISLVNGPLIIVGQGPFPTIIAGFADIVTTASSAIVQMNDMTPVPAGPLSDAIFDAFREFVRVHQVLLNILIGKSGLFSTVPFIGAPVAAVLRQVEAVVDTIAFSLIDNVESRAADLQKQAEGLSQSLDQAINSYNGLLSKRHIARGEKIVRRQAVSAA